MAEACAPTAAPGPVPGRDDEALRLAQAALDAAQAHGDPRQVATAACALVDALRGTTERQHLRIVELNATLHRRMAEAEMLRHQLHEQSLHDALTGLPNRRMLFETAAGLLERSRRQGQPLCAALIDLDHFRHLNEEHGHEAGDLVLRRFAQLLQRTVRRSDMVCRYDGEEFVALLTDIDAEGAHRMLGRLLEHWLDEAVHLGGHRLPPGSFSAGIALFPQHGDTLQVLLQRADMALYAAKGIGRARIEIASPMSAASLN